MTNFAVASAICISLCGCEQGFKRVKCFVFVDGQRAFVASWGEESRHGRQGETLFAQASKHFFAADDEFKALNPGLEDSPQWIVKGKVEVVCGTFRIVVNELRLVRDVVKSGRVFWKLAPDEVERLLWLADQEAQSPKNSRDRESQDSL